MARSMNLEHKVKFMGYVQPEKLREYTLRATIGLTLFANKGLSNKYSLANRFFDYMHAGVPQVAMHYPEYESFNNEYEVAILIDRLDEDHIARAIKRLLKDRALYNKLKANSLRAREVYNWQNEEKKLISVYENLEV